MTRFRHAAHEVDAMLFDGTPDRAAEISRLLGCSIADHGSAIEVGTPFGRVYIGTGMWVVRNRSSKALSVVDDREFAAQVEAIGPVRVLGMADAYEAGMVAP